MNEFCVDVGYNSLVKNGEVLCGDNVSTITRDDGTFIAVLADGLGSGVKACILSTLTSKIISTMISEDIDLTECVKTIAATLPICSVRGLAYSTFTIVKILPTQDAEIIQYEPGRHLSARRQKRRAALFHDKHRRKGDQALPHTPARERHLHPDKRRRRTLRSRRGRRLLRVRLGAAEHHPVHGDICRGRFFRKDTLLDTAR